MGTVSRYLVIALLVAGGFLAFLAFEYWWTKGSSVHFVLPNGFVGYFRIGQEDSASETVRSGGRWIYRIPSDGTLVVQDLRPLKLIEMMTANYGNGEGIPARPWSQQDQSRSGIGLHIVSADSEGWIYFLVGTDQQLKESRNLYEFPVGDIHSSEE